MKYRKDLYLLKKSRLTMLFSVMSISLGLAIWAYKDFSLFGLGQSIFIIIMGFIGIAYGIGYNPERLIGKSFINIDENEFTLKTNAFKKAQSIKWKNIDKIKYIAAVYIFTDKEGNSFKVDLKSLDYEVIQEIKNVVSMHAKSNDIQLLYE